MDQVEDELITAIDTLLQTEPLDEEGLCPWCGEIRAVWARPTQRGLSVAAPRARLSDLGRRLIQEDRVRAVLPEVDAMVGEGFITLEKVEVIAYRGKPAA